MSKREATMFAAQGVDVDAPRAKRHKPAPATASTSTLSSGHAGTSNGVHNPDGESASKADDVETVKEKGLKLWQTIKDAVNKEGRVLSYDFLRLPSKRQYTDYYEIIKRPIALDDIKRQLEAGQYALFDEVRHDLEQCFKNAKKYNIKESQIWKDAKYLHKLVIKESNRLTGTPDEPEGADEADGADGAGSDGDDGDKKKKAPNMNRILKGRLQKLVAKTDDTGRILSAEFMELPNRKQWPSYYKVIKKPQCFENIFKHLKRKEYNTSSEFANDVELVFSNALEFNQEHTPIWTDAVVLRDFFRQLMSDLPVPFTIPAYTLPDHSTKIKLKMPAMVQHGGLAGARGPVLMNADGSNNPKLTLPARPTSSTANVNPIDAHTSAFQIDTIPTTTLSRNTTLSPRIVAAPLQTGPSVNPLPNAQFNDAHLHHYPNAAYDNTLASTSSAASLPVPAQPQQIHYTEVQASTISPIPDLSNRRQLRFVSIITHPGGRIVNMDSADGVNNWAIRLGWQDTSLVITGIKFLNPAEDAEDSSDDDDHGKQAKDRDEHDDPDDDDELQTKTKTKRPRGRPRKKVRAKASEGGAGKGKAIAQMAPVVEVHVRLNGVTVAPDEGEGDTWNVELRVGSNLVEVGELDGHVWRMYVERVGSGYH